VLYRGKRIKMGLPASKVYHNMGYYSNDELLHGNECQSSANLLRMIKSAYL